MDELLSEIYPTFGDLLRKGDICHDSKHRTPRPSDHCWAVSSATEGDPLVVGKFVAETVDSFCKGFIGLDCEKEMREGIGKMGIDTALVNYTSGANASIRGGTI